jgi:CRISPR-associated protein Csb1
VPHHRIEFTARDVRLFVNLDLATMRGYALPEAANKLLVALALWKVRRFLESGLRLRTACDMQVEGEVRMPSTKDLGDALKSLLAECKPAFASPAVTRVKFKPRKAKAAAREGGEAGES